MMTTQDLQAMHGRTAVDPDGSRIGKIGQIYVDDTTSLPVWVTVSTGMFGTKESFAPLYGSRAEGDALQLAVTKDMLKGAPSIDADGQIGDDENGALYDYYAGYLGDSPTLTGAEGGLYQDAAADRRDDLTGQPAAQGEASRARLRRHTTGNVTGDHGTSEFPHQRQLGEPGTTPRDTGR
jgi:hypothetical protein